MKREKVEKGKTEKKNPWEEKREGEGNEDLKEEEKREGNDGGKGKGKGKKSDMKSGKKSGKGKGKKSGGVDSQPTPIAPPKNRPSIGPVYPVLPDKSDHSPFKIDKIPHHFIAEVLSDSNGKISVAASRLNVSHWTLKKYIDRHSDLVEILNYAREAELDFVEDRLMNQVRMNNITAMIFYLKCHGKGRGWLERPTEDRKTGKTNVSFKYTVVVQDWGREDRKTGKGNDQVIDVTMTEENDVTGKGSGGGLLPPPGEVRRRRRSDGKPGPGPEEEEVRW